MATETISLERETARTLYREALNAAQEVGFSFSPEPLRLTPQEQLVAIVRQSQELVLLGKGGEAEDAGDDK